MKTLTFEGNASEYFKIWIVNIMLMIVTLGIYYPWAKVRNKRYFYGNTYLDGRNFNYHATGQQLFLGYLIASGVFIAYAVISEFWPFIGLGFLAVLMLGFPWVVWRSLKFNLRMSSYSNVRFSFDAGLGNAYVNYMLLPFGGILVLYGIPGALVAVYAMGYLESQVLAVVLGVVIFLAWMPLILFVIALIQKRTTSYVVDGYRFGQGVFSSNLEVKEFALILLKTTGVSIAVFGAAMMLVSIVSVVFALIGVGAGAIAGGGLDAIGDEESMNDMFALGVGLAVVIPMYVGLILANFVVIAYMQARQRRYIFSNTKLDGEIDFESALTARSLAMVMVTNFLAVAFSLGLAYPWAKVRMARLMLENTVVYADDGLDQYVSQKQEEQSSLGEQLGDAFDVEIGLGI